jgi:hypothetical protein
MARSTPPRKCWWGGGSEVDGEAIACVDLGKFVLNPGEADLESPDFAEPAAKFGLDDSVLEVAADLFQAWSLRWVRPEKRTSDTSFSERGFYEVERRHRAILLGTS